VVKTKLKTDLKFRARTCRDNYIGFKTKSQALFVFCLWFQS